MERKLVLILAIIFMSNVKSQEIEEKNSDLLLQSGLTLYKKGNYQNSLKYANKGLLIAPLYHDIRLLRVRIYHALNLLEKGKEDLSFLITNAPEYPGVKKLLLKQIRITLDPQEGMLLLKTTSKHYPNDLDFEVLEAYLKMKNNEYSAARDLSIELLKHRKPNSAQRYTLNQILKNTVKSIWSTSYELIDFNDGYGERKSWQTNRLEYQHNIKKTSLLARITYSNRVISDGFLYEVETYPTLNDKLYFFINLGVSNGDLFPNFRSSASAFYNIAKGLEVEAGSRVQSFDREKFLTGVLGLTNYVGHSYFNLRTALGPKREGRLIQNYQFNYRYYYNGADNYAFARLSRGISPDESILFSQVQENPKLKVNFIGLGLNTKLGLSHILNFNVGLLFEEITASRSGRQFLGGIRYAYRL